MFEKNSLCIKYLFPLVGGLVIAFVGWNIVLTAIYNYQLIKFHDISWSFEEHGISSNGVANFGKKVSIKQLEITEPTSGVGTVGEWCPEFTSSRGRITMSFVGDVSVCCWAHSKQKTVPFKEQSGFQYFLCGEAPFLDIVKKRLI